MGGVAAAVSGAQCSAWYGFFIRWTLPSAAAPLALIGLAIYVFVTGVYLARLYLLSWGRGRALGLAVVAVVPVYSFLTTMPLLADYEWDPAIAMLIAPLAIAALALSAAWACWPALRSSDRGEPLARVPPP